MCVCVCVRSMQSAGSTRSATVSDDSSGVFTALVCHEPRRRQPVLRSSCCRTCSPAQWGRGTEPRRGTVYHRVARQTRFSAVIFGNEVVGERMFHGSGECDIHLHIYSMINIPCVDILTFFKIFWIFAVILFDFALYKLFTCYAWIEQGGCLGSYWMDEADNRRLMTTIGVSGWMFLLVPAHPGCSGQNP